MMSLKIAAALFFNIREDKCIEDLTLRSGLHTMASQAVCGLQSSCLKPRARRCKRPDPISYNLNVLLLSAGWSGLLATLVAVKSIAFASEARLQTRFRHGSGRGALVPAMNLRFRSRRRRLRLVRTRSLSVLCGRCHMHGRTLWQHR